MISGVALAGSRALPFPRIDHPTDSRALLQALAPVTSWPRESLVWCDELVVHFRQYQALAEQWGERHGLEFLRRARHDQAVLYRNLQPSQTAADCEPRVAALGALEEVRLVQVNRPRLRPARDLPRLPSRSSRSRYKSDDARLVASLLRQLTEADLELVLSEAADPLSAGQILQLNGRILNYGPATASGIRLQLQPDGQLSFATGTGLQCTGGQQPLCTLATPLPAGQARDFTIYLSPGDAASGALLTSATLNAAQLDPVPANNRDSVSTRIITSTAGQADLALSLRTLTSGVTPGSELRLLLDLSNTGPIAASAARLQLQLPGQLHSATLVGQTCTQAGNQLNCNLGSLATGQSVLTFSAQVDAIAADLYHIDAHLSASTQDPDSTNNQAALYLYPTHSVAWQDPLYPQQWHLHNTGQNFARPGVDLNLLPVWQQGLDGSGVVVGVIDDGVELSHEDLTANANRSLSWDYNSNDPNPIHNQHGTAVAGIIAATANNGKGGLGVAPGAQIAGIRAHSTTDLNESLALDHKRSIHAYNNSWGPADGSRKLDGPGPLARAAIQAGIAHGRGGLGAIYCWAVGNGGGSSSANYDGYANSRYAIAVGAHTDQGQHAFYSEGGANLLITVPSDGGFNAITTTDRSGSEGYAPGKYTDSFGGTSAATPMACGVVALLLQARPDLGWRDVPYLLALSAQQLQPADPGWSSNGAGMLFNPKYGFGAIDAERLIALAELWQPLDPEVSREYSRQPNLAIPDNQPSGIEDQIQVSDNLWLETVELVFNAEDHPYWGDLEITLTSPAGTVSRLADLHDTGRYSDAYRDWIFQSRQFLGESTQGRWTLTVRDRRSGDVGTLKHWTLRLHGTQLPPIIPGSVNRQDLRLAARVSGTRYRLRLMNQGPDSAENLLTRVQLPNGINARSIAITQGSCTGTNDIQCSSGRLEANREILLELQLPDDTPQGGSILAEASAAGSELVTRDNQLATPISGTNPEPVSTQRLTVTVTGYGRLRSSDGRIDCPGRCSADYALGSQILLTAQPANSLVRTEGWDRICFGSDRQCQVTLTEDAEVGVDFRPDWLRLIR